MVARHSNLVGFYVAREDAMRREEDAGRLAFFCCANDGNEHHMVLLVALKNVFAAHLPNIPRDYVVRHMMDGRHKSMVVVAEGLVLGGITYRPFPEQGFGEVVFCAVSSQHQIKGFGTRMMNHLKQHVRDVDGLTHLLTFADNNALGYFRKQGFSEEISLPRDQYHGYIKEYVGCVLMESKIDPKLPYTYLSAMIRRQRAALEERIRHLSDYQVVHRGIHISRGHQIVPSTIPGLTEAGWTTDQYGYSLYQAVPRDYIKSLMTKVLVAVAAHPNAWPFQYPVDRARIPDYYAIIKNPMDLNTIRSRLESDNYYITLEMFVADMQRIFDNARMYNADGTIYHVCANRLEAYFRERLRAEVERIVEELYGSSSGTSSGSDEDSESSHQEEEEEEEERKYRRGECSGKGKALAK